MTVGIDEAGKIKEIFLCRFQVGSDQIGIITDTCVLINNCFNVVLHLKSWLMACSPYSLIGYLMEALLNDKID
jgi:hypothetical protein